MLVQIKDAKNGLSWYLPYSTKKGLLDAKCTANFEAREEVLTNHTQSRARHQASSVLKQQKFPSRLWYVKAEVNSWLRIQIHD